MPRKKVEDLKVTVSVDGGPEVELSGNTEQDARTLAPHLAAALAGTGLLRDYDNHERAITQELVLAIDDRDFGPEIGKSRIFTMEERTTEFRITRLRAAMEAKNLLDDSPAGERNKKRLRQLADEPNKLLDLEAEFLEKPDRQRNGEWIAPEDWFVLDEAVQITTFVIATYRRDLIGKRIAVIMAKEIPPVNRRGRLGTAAKLPGKMRYLSLFDALITLDWNSWTRISDKDRQRLIHHELLHLEVGDKNALQVRMHDFEDFADVVDIYGLRSETNSFSTDGHVSDVLRNASAQLELLERAG